jgi:hypothetical protein
MRPRRHQWFAVAAVLTGKHLALNMSRTSGTLQTKPTGRYFTRILSI